MLFPISWVDRMFLVSRLDTIYEDRFYLKLCNTKLTSEVWEFASFPGRIPLPSALGFVWVLVVCFVCVLLVSCIQGNLISVLLRILVVDRPCLALARQCRKKNI